MNRKLWSISLLSITEKLRNTRFKAKSSLVIYQKKLPDTAPYAPGSLEDILNDVSRVFYQGSPLAKPQFFAYFQANASTAGFLGEMLCSGLNVVLQLDFIHCCNGARIHCYGLDGEKCSSFHLHFSFWKLEGESCMEALAEAVVCTLAAARDKTLEKLGGSENITRLVVYASDQTHVTVEKSAKLIGITKSISGSYYIVFNKLHYHLKGTTACGAVDPIMELGKIAREYKCGSILMQIMQEVLVFAPNSGLIWTELNLLIHQHEPT
ncbi:hypothetical protein LWI28_006023 [Acer negundo]|uniref:Uncharacterized protein n=1 Tax=Acer negundo TaxID=4023 RepID=A0AAD5J3Y2_ACENE|nr:hypothetical protein LWI28_006023 [Acer negundo]